jgi:hypothetical protein
MASPAEVHKGKDIRMALLFCKLSFRRTAILLWLLAIFAGPLLNDPPLVSAPAASSLSRATSAANGQQAESQPRSAQSNEESSLPLSQKQKNDLLKSNFEKMKHDASELADLAKALKEELNKSNENILSLDIVDKADKIEKLARRIKGTARGF